MEPMVAVVSAFDPEIAALVLLIVPDDFQQPPVTPAVGGLPGAP